MTRLVIGVMALLVCMSVDASAQERCKVTDPTGTPLNVRDGPNGKVVGVMVNGTIVTITNNANDGKGRAWSFVAEHSTGKPIGWVFREFISCF